MSDRWHILGVGSIGGLFAHRLSAGERMSGCSPETLLKRIAS